MKSFSFQIPTKFVFGAGALNDMAEMPLPGQKPLIVLGGKSIFMSGNADRLFGMMEKRFGGYALFKDAKQNPTADMVMEATEIAKSNGCDFVIGMGGGSTIDVAKAAAMMAANEGTLWDHVTVGTGLKKPFSNKTLPLVCIPTSTGTGAESNKTAVITNSKTNEKVGVRVDFPALSIVDPELSLGVPKNYTIYQGLDALYHNMESTLSVLSCPMNEPMAYEAVKNIYHYLPQVIADPQDLEARSQMAWAATVGGAVIVISSCSGAHTIEHALSGLNPDVPHGLGLMMIFQAFHGWFAERIPERYAKLADAIGVSKPGQSDPEKAQAFLNGMIDLEKACGYQKKTLSDFGFGENDISRIVDMTFVIGGGKLSRDRSTLSREDVAEILRKSL